MILEDEPLFSRGGGSVTICDCVHLYVNYNCM
jgi:hypothetical protein